MKIQLVDDWRKAYKWLSVWFGGAAAALQAWYVTLDGPQRAALSPEQIHWVSGITLFLALGAVTGRVIKQSPPEDPPA